MDNKDVHHASHNKTNVHANNRSLWERFWCDKDGHITVVQVPNIWLIIWLILEVVSLFAASHRTEEVSWWLASAALGIWSLLEIFRGVNYFRRLLGLCIALLTLSTVFGIRL